MVKSLIFILCLLAIVRPAIVYLDANASSTNATDLAMQEDNSTYILYTWRNTSNSPSQLRLVRQFSNGSLSDFSILDSGRDYGEGDVETIQSGLILTAITGTRNITATNFTDDVILGVSSANFSNWTTGIELGKNTNDSSSRSMPWIIISNDTREASLFYIDRNNKNYSIGYSNLLNGSSTFNPETLLFTDIQPIISVSAAFTSRNTRMRHVVWQLRNSSLMYSNSTDGKNWAQPMKLAEAFIQPDVEPSMYIMSNLNLSTSVLFVSYIGLDNIGKLLISVDEGRSWNTPLNLTNGTVISFVPAFCGNAATQSIFFMQKSINGTELYEFNIPNQITIKREMEIPKGEIFDPVMECQFENNKYNVRLIGTLLPNQTAFIASDDFPVNL